MKTVSSKPSLNGEEFELGELLATNKSLAMEKREVHRQKLRQYSEKAVKLKEILRSSTDQSERKCIEGKLRALQEKQDAEISKLAKIDQIENEIDEYMNEESHPSLKKSLCKSRNEGLYGIENEHTPAKRLKTKTVLTKEMINSEEGNFLDNSVKSNNLNSSGVLLARQSSDKKSRALRDLNENDLKHKEEQRPRAKITKESRAQSYWQPSTKVPQQEEQKYAKFQKNPLMAYTRQQSYKESKFSKEHYLREEQQRIVNINKETKQKQELLTQLEQKIAQMVDQERYLMQRIDGFQKEEAILQKKTNSFLNSISRSKDIILSSGLILEQLGQIDLKEKGSHQFSIDSLSSQPISEGCYGLSMQLAGFEKLLEQFLLSAEREAMLTSGQLQQCGLKINRLREQCSTLESKKKGLESETQRLDQLLPGKRKELKALEETCNRLKHQIPEFQQLGQLKKKLANELQEKCEKLKGKKKQLGEKIQKGQKQLQAIQQQYSARSRTLKEMQENLQQSLSQQKEIEQLLIFTGRKVDLVKDSSKDLEKHKGNLEAKISETTRSHEKILLEICQSQKQLVDIKSQIASKSSEEGQLQERIRKIEKQLNESTSILNEQRGIINNQNQQINTKSNELLEMQKKIISVADSMRAIESENAKLNECILNEKQEIEELSKKKEETKRAKDQLEEILREVIEKKESLLCEVEDRSNELELLLTDLMEGQQQLTSTTEKYTQIEVQLRQILEEYTSNETKLQEIKEEMEEMMEEQSNILARVSKLKQAEKQMLLQIGIKGSAIRLDQETKVRVAQAVADMDIISTLKAQLKECKHENRKLKLDNQRLSKLIEIEPIDQSR